MSDPLALAIFGLAVVVVVGLFVAAIFIRGWIFRTILGRVRGDLDQLDVVRGVTGDPALPPRNLRESLFAAMSGRPARQPAAWRRGRTKQQEPWSEVMGSHDEETKR